MMKKSLFKLVACAMLSAAFVTTCPVTNFTASTIEAASTGKAKVVTYSSSTLVIQVSNVSKWENAITTVEDNYVGDGLYVKYRGTWYDYDHYYVDTNGNFHLYYYA